MDRDELVARIRAADFVIDENFDGADLAGVDLAGAMFENVSFRGANLRGARVKELLANRCDRTGADLTGADMHLTKLVKCNLSKAIFDKVQMVAGSIVDGDL